MLSLYKSRIRVICIALLLSGAVIMAPAHAQTDTEDIFNVLLKDSRSLLPDPKGAFISTDIFIERYASTIKRVNQYESITISDGEVAAVKPAMEPVNRASREEWHLILSGSRKENAAEILIQPAPAVLVNHNRWFHYVFLSQDIHPIVYDRVNEKLAKRQQEIKGKQEDVTVTFSRHGNRMVFSAIYDFINDEKDLKRHSDFGRAIARESDLEERIRFVMKESCDLISAILFETKRAEKDARKELEAQTLSYLNRDNFVFLINDGYEDWDVLEGPKEGRWDFTGGETEALYEIYNFGDRLVFSINEKLPVSTSEAQRNEIVKQVDALVAKKPAKGAQSMEVLLHPEDTDYIWVKANLALDGKIKGKEVAKYYSDFKYDYAREFHKKIQNVFKDYEKAAEKTVKEGQGKTYASLTQDEFMLLADDELEENLDPVEGVQGGHWAFVVGEEERDCEIFNYGDRIVYTLAMQLPTDDEDAIAEITDKVLALVKKMPAEKSSGMEVTPYPEYDNYVWIKASYTLDSGLKGKDVNKQYQDFVYDYSEKLYSKISDILEEYE